MAFSLHAVSSRSAIKTTVAKAAFEAVQRFGKFEVGRPAAERVGERAARNDESVGSRAYRLDERCQKCRRDVARAGADDSNRARSWRRSGSVSAPVHLCTPARLRRQPFRQCRRDCCPDCRRLGRDRVEVGARQPDDDAVANGAHGRGPIAAGEERDLADRRAMRDFGDRFSMTFDLDREATRDDDEERVCALPLMHDAIAAPDGQGIETLFEQAQSFGRQILEGCNAREREMLRRHRGAAWQAFRALYHTGAPQSETLHCETSDEINLPKPRHAPS